MPKFRVVLDVQTSVDVDAADEDQAITIAEEAVEKGRPNALSGIFSITVAEDVQKL